MRDGRKECAIHNPVAVRYATGNSGCIPDGMPGKAGAMRFYRAIFPTGMGQMLGRPGTGCLDASDCV
jgi:hypothetical protein